MPKLDQHSNVDYVASDRDLLNWSSSWNFRLPFAMGRVR